MTILVFLPLFAVTASAAGTTSANFLKIASGARARGMGETFVGVCDDVHSMYWNPAGLALLKNRELSFLYTKWLVDMSYQNVQYAQPVKFGIGPSHTLGFGLYNLSYGEIKGYDHEGRSISDPQANGLALSVSNAFTIYKSDDLKSHFGLNVKYITEKLHSYSAGAVAIDSGVFVEKGYFGFGAAVRNIGTPLTFVKESYPLPLNLAIGSSFKKNLFGLEDPFTAAIDINIPNDSEVIANFGIEYWAANLLGIRCGYKTGQKIGSGLRFGLGFRMNIVQIDFAYAAYGGLGDTFHTGITLKFGKPLKLRITSQPAAVEESTKLYNNAKVLYDNGRYADAILELDKLLEIDPTNNEALELMKKAYEKFSSQ
ncbi:MAG: hypothetical protein DDT19_02333 [Syntrophomonadaceae bacterium]|nr:hypothetical protein [Bacillota bacterium]